MKKTSLYFLLLGFTYRFCYSISCWTCNSYESNQDCNSSGSLRECKENHVCQNTLRVFDDARVITKQCIARRSCANRCRRSGNHIVCRHCCYTDECNGRQYISSFNEEMESWHEHMDEHGSQSVSTCENLIIRHGSVRCIRLKSGNVAGTTCVFWCRNDYILVGPTRLTCFQGGNSAAWSGVPPRCMAFKVDQTFENLGSCLPLSYDKNTTDMNCSRGYKFKSACTFTCKEGHYMVYKEKIILSGSKKVVCSRGVREPVTWIGRAPRCLPKRCSTLEHGKASYSICTNGHFVGSICENTCWRGYETFDERFVACSMNGEDEHISWNGTAPSCELRTCRALERTEAMHSLICSNGNFFSSRCTTSCRKGYFMMDTEGNKILQRNNANTICDVGDDDNMKWQPPPPQCQLKTCRNGTSISNGLASCSDGNNYNSTCTYACHDAFLMVGISTITCVDDKTVVGEYGKWNVPKPWCRPKVCQPLPYNMENIERTCTNGDKFGSICTYRCLQGYFMTAADEVTLILSGTFNSSCELTKEKEISWTWEAPVCHSKLCDELDASANGKISCTDSNNHNSVCNFSCNAGYTLKGAETILCESQGVHIPKNVWNHDPPSCEPKPCKEVAYNSRTMDMECSSGFSYRSTCTFDCKTGYYMTSAMSGNIINSASTTCRLNTDLELEWVRAAPICLQKSCDALSVPQYSTMECTADTRHNSVCKFTCSPGYEIDTVAELRCEDDGINKPEGQWNHETPKCIPRLCPTLEIDNVTEVVCDVEYKFLSVCRFNCVEGYYMTTATDSQVVDEATAVCRVVGSNMVWSALPPVCKIKSCPVLSWPEKGIFRCSKKNIFSSTCSFLCRPGFYLLGEASITCDDNGLNNPKGAWSNDAPTCERKPCTAPVRIEGDQLYESCTDGYLFESICTYNCSRGFYLVQFGRVASINRSPVKCGVTGRDMTWSSPLPQCEVVTCDILRVPENGFVTCTDSNQFESTCEFSCMPGYEIDGVHSLTCDEREDNSAIGRWSEDPPLCSPKSCPELSFDAKKLRMKCDDERRFTSTCSFSCVNGYYMTPEDGDGFLSAASTTCEVDDKEVMLWSEKPPICRIKHCHLMPAPQDGNVVCSDENTFGSLCTFSCDPGFLLSGSKESKCLDMDERMIYGNWSDKAPQCEARSCPRLKYDEDAGTVNCSMGDKYQSECSFGCVRGYYMTSARGRKVVDSTTTSCDVRNDEMLWTNLSPKCLIKRCPQARDPEDGQVTCTNGNEYLSTCSFTCSITNELKGEGTIACEADDRNVPAGIWNAPFPTCELRSCPNWNYDKLSIAESCENDYKYGSTCTFSCREGYYLPGKNKKSSEGYTNAKCGIKGTVMTWSGRLPACEMKTCVPMIFPTNGSYECSNGTDYQSECKFSCEVGFLLLGRKVIRCEDDGSNLPTGIWDSIEPTCEPRSCEELTYDHETQITECSHGERYGSVCDFKCIEGYYMTEPDGVTLSDDMSAVCKDDPEDNQAVLWKVDEPKCFIKNCPKMIPPADGFVECDTGTLFGSVCEFKCLPGYGMVGPAQISCMDDGQNVPLGAWDKEPPICEPRICPRLVNNNDTSTYQCTDGWNYKSVCTSTCKPGYFITKSDGRTIVKSGKSTTTCGRGVGFGMAWTKQLPDCLSKFCLAIKPQKNMTMSCTDGFLFKSRCSFKCDEPLRLTGPPVLNCVDTGKVSFHGAWDGRTSRCRP